MRIDFITLLAGAVYIASSFETVDAFAAPKPSVSVLDKLSGPQMDEVVPPLESMLRSSQLVYSYATIRDLVNDHDEVVGRNTKNNKLVKFDTPALVVTQDGADENRHIQTSVLKYPITAAAILEFIKRNRHLINDDLKLRKDALNKTPQDFAPLPIEAKLQESKESYDADIWEFDDEYDSNELVFCVIVNRSEKRLTCVFRGSVTGGDDWSTNFKFLKTSPDVIAEFANKKFGIHRGFANYLFNADWTKKGDPSKFEQIAMIFDEIHEWKDPEGKTPYKDFEIFVTGHSLGGALTQLLSCALAGSSRTRAYPGPITAISFASPQVGDRGWVDAYQALEKEGRLRHLRLFNKGDYVAVNPAIPFMGYTQTGVGVTLRRDQKATVGYRNAMSAWSAVFSFSNPLKMHNLDVHHDRLFNNDNQDLLKTSIEDIYDDNAGDFTA